MLVLRSEEGNVWELCKLFSDQFLSPALPHIYIKHTLTSNFSSYYGGSTVIVLYPPGEVVLDEDLVKNSTELRMETLMKVGWRTGIKA